MCLNENPLMSAMTVTPAICVFTCCVKDINNKCDVNNGELEMLKWRPLLQRAQGEHRPRHRTPQPAECLGPIFLRQLSFPGTIIQSNWQNHICPLRHVLGSSFSHPVERCKPSSRAHLSSRTLCSN